MNLILFDSERNQKLIIIELNYYGIFNYEVIQNKKGFLGICVVGKGSWKEREVGKSEVEKFLFKLERAKRSWKEPSEVQLGLGPDSEIDPNSILRT